MKKRIVGILIGIVFLIGGYIAYGRYTDQQHYQEAQTAINQLFSDKEHEILADDVNEALLKENQNKLQLVDDKTKRAGLNKELQKAKSLFEAEELAKKRVSALMKNGVMVDQITTAQLDETQTLVTRLTDKTLKTQLQSIIDQAKEQWNVLTRATEAVTALFTDASHHSLIEKVDRKTYTDVKALVDPIQNQSKKQALTELLASADTLLTEREKEQEKAKAVAEAAAKAEAMEAVNDSQTSSESHASGNQSSTPKSNSVQTPSTNQSVGQQETDFAKIVASSKTAQRTDQIVTVVASGTRATVTLWEKSNQVWHKIFTTNGYVGSQGVGAASEGSKRTPRGAYSLGFAFGASNPGTKVPFKPVTANSYWISDVNSDLYNTWQEGNYAGHGNEHLADYVNNQYYYAMVINYNTSAVKGAGSAFFLHVSNGRPTAGCVSVPKSEMEKFMKRIHPGAYIINVTSESEVAKW
ncbi:toxin Cry1Ac domain D-VI-related protein [Neobacillus jeddahensis]|uniref:toxin Cry1Ac domain D-VI-related protein n=1 Tax=Neobacillus jeddahensis TaxID=1461580 RepID=UPI000A475A33|nr:toxin Cry1Ac domain D-VI-related protein [Neobacillus jeddahensis]